MPDISVLLPFRNAAGTLGECIESIARQTLSGWELVAVDDGSADDGAGIVRELAERDPRVRLIRTGGTGLVAALNKGLLECRAPLVARMDADDLMHPDRLDEQVRFLADHPDIVLAGCQVELFPEEAIQAGYREYVRWQNDCLTAEDVAENIFVESPLAHPSVAFRREDVLRLGGYRDGRFPEDYELWLRMFAAGLRMAKVPRVLLRWREREDRISRVDARYGRPAFDELRAEFLARDSRLGEGREIIVWGSGRRTRKRVRLLSDRGARISAWIDIDPDRIGRVVEGLLVQPSAWLDREPRPFVLIYVTNHGARELIGSKLARLGYARGRDYLAVG